MMNKLHVENWWSASLIRHTNVMKVQLHLTDLYYCQNLNHFQILKTQINTQGLTQICHCYRCPHEGAVSVSSVSHNPLQLQWALTSITSHAACRTIHLFTFGKLWIFNMWLSGKEKERQTSSTLWRSEESSIDLINSSSPVKAMLTSSKSKRKFKTSKFQLNSYSD